MQSAGVLASPRHHETRHPRNPRRRPREVEFEHAWDRQMDADAKAGRLDFLLREADDAIRTDSLRKGPDGTKP